MINDINALRAPKALEIAAKSDCAVCLMHMQGTPLTMQQSPGYSNVVSEVRDFFVERLAAMKAVGIDLKRLILDPGFGFGKTLHHNLELIRHLGDISVNGLPVLAGLSRKSMLGEITGRAVTERLAASITAAVLAAQRGAKILRVHDVAQTRDALAVMHKVLEKSDANRS
jgi:dihydropteroate synthase